jgi:hypothetical protein
MQLGSCKTDMLPVCFLLLLLLLLLLPLTAMQCCQALQHCQNAIFGGEGKVAV